MPSKAPLMFPSQSVLLADMGERLRLARLRRRLSVDIMCERARVSRMTLYRIEQGNSAVSLGMYLNVLAVLKLESDLALLAQDDRMGRLLQDSALAPRRRARSVVATATAAAAGGGKP